MEIQTYSGPSRRLWMGPQYSFKNFEAQADNENIDEDDDPSLQLPDRSSPVNIGNGKDLVVIDARSFSKLLI